MKQLKPKPKAQSPILEAVYETASDLHRLGFIHKRNMHKFDVLCLAKYPTKVTKKSAPCARVLLLVGG
jgi:hypothetical protein